MRTIRSSFTLLLVVGWAATLEAQTVDPGPSVWAASAAEIGWVRRNAIPLRTDAPGSGTADLEQLRPLVSGARVVGLGEGTHGTREFFRLKHRMVEWLAREGFTVFALEVGMAEARALNEYVLTGRGDARSALAGTLFWTWNTEEVLDLVEWMRAYNASGRGRMEFWGVDVQLPNLAADSVRAFVARADPAFLPALDSAYTAARGVWRSGASDTVQGAIWRDRAAEVRAHLERSRHAYRGVDTLQWAWAIQNARIVEQSAEMYRWGRSRAGQMQGSKARDRAMAENLEWILAHQPAGTRAILWAANTHVERAPDWLGGILASRFGDGYRAFGFAFGEGDYTARGPGGVVGPYPAAPPPPGTVEHALRATGLPRFVVDLRRAAAEPNGAWLAEPHPFRIIGAGMRPDAFWPKRLAPGFDALLYVDRTRASVPLPMNPGPRAGSAAGPR